MLLYFHGGDVSLSLLIFWLVVVPILLVCLLVFIDRNYRKNSADYKNNANPLSLNEKPDKENK